MSSREKPSFPRKILKTNDRNFNASGVSRQNLGNFGVTALVGCLRFGFETVRGTRSLAVRNPQPWVRSGAAPLIKLSKILAIISGIIYTSTC